MESNREVVCIICPTGCRINVITNEDNNILKIENAQCKNGEAYATNEIQCPKRSLTSTVKVVGGSLPLVSVRSDKPIPKEKIQAAVEKLRQLELKAPISFHQVIIKDILETGANIIATKEILK